MTDNNIIGVLYKAPAGATTDQAVHLAVINFNRSPHTKGHYPAEIHFNPAELPNELEIHGLTTIPDDQVRPGHIRVTTHTLTPQAELAYERARFAVQVERTVNGAS